MTKESQDLSVRNKNAKNKKAIQKLQIKRESLKLISVEDAKHICTVNEPEKEYRDKTKYIQKHFGTVMKVAECLHYIHDKRLYRLQYNTFEDYLQEEFNYTRGRGYQLIDANKVAKEINKQIGEDIIVSEPQCRELLRLKIYEGVDHQKIDKDKTSNARLELIIRLSKDNDNVKTAVIAEEVDKLLKKENDKQDKNVEFYSQNIKWTCSGINKVLTNIFSDDKLKSEDKKSIKVKAIEQLEELLKELKANKI